MINYSEKAILNILKDHHGIQFLTRDTYGILEGHTAKPEYIDNMWWPSGKDEQCLQLWDTTYETLILDNDLPINPNQIKFDDITFENSPISIDQLLD